MCVPVFEHLQLSLSLVSPLIFPYSLQLSVPGMTASVEAHVLVTF